MKTKEEQINRIAKTIDPNNTFLNECEEVVKKRFEDMKYKLGGEKE